MENLLETHPSIAASICDPHVPVDEVTAKILSLFVQQAQTRDLNGEIFLCNFYTFSWSLWKPLFQLAEEDGTVHERVIALVIALKGSDIEMGRAPSTIPVGSRRPKLPVLQKVVQDYWNVLELPYIVTEEPALSVLEGDIVVPPSADSELGQIAKARTEYLNMHHFVSRLWKEAGIDFSHYGLSIMQYVVDNCVSGEPQQKDQLLTDSDTAMAVDADDSTDMDPITATERLVHLDSEDDEDDEDDFMPEDEDEDEDDDDEEENANLPTLNLAVEAASIWVNHCAEALYQTLHQSTDSPNTVPVKWLAWKHAFENVANKPGGRARITTLAKSAIEQMENVERSELKVYMSKLLV